MYNIGYYAGTGSPWMRIEPFRTEHLLKIEITEVDGLGETSKQVLANAAKNSIAYTALNNDSIMFIVGAAQLWPGLVDLWLIVTPEFMLHKKSCLRIFWQFMAQLKDMGIRRAQADIRADLSKNISFVKHFGFTFESEMKQYGVNGETYLRYVWFGD